MQALEAKNDQQPTKWMTKNQKATWLAYNRRADVVLEPTGQESAKIYPNQSQYARMLWQRPEPSLKKVELASKALSSGMQQASLNQSGK